MSECKHAKLTRVWSEYTLMDSSKSTPNDNNEKFPTSASQASLMPSHSSSDLRLLKNIPINKEGLIASSPYPIHSNYIVKEKIGQGTWGTVHLAIERTSGLERAVKKIPKRFTSELQRFRQEIMFIKSLDHPNIVRLYETFEDYANIYMVIEYCRGSELFDHLSKAKFFCEATAANLTRQMLSAVTYIHKKNIAHRDLKPENFLFLFKDDRSPMKLIDFGLAKRFSTKRKMRTKVGTLYYVSPEVLQGMYDEKCDLWSIGVILHILLCGIAPFNGPSDGAIIQQIQRGAVRFHESTWGGISSQAKDLVSMLLNRDPVSRPSAAEALQHPWFNIFAPSQLISRISMRRPMSMPAFAIRFNSPGNSFGRLSGAGQMLNCPSGSRHAYKNPILTPQKDDTRDITANDNNTNNNNDNNKQKSSCCELAVLGIHSPLCASRNTNQSLVSTAGTSLKPSEGQGVMSGQMQLDDRLGGNYRKHSSIGTPPLNIPKAPIQTVNLSSLTGLGKNLPDTFAAPDNLKSIERPPSNKISQSRHGSLLDSEASNVYQSPPNIDLPKKYEGEESDRTELEVWRNLSRRLVPKWRRFAMHNQLKKAALHVIAQQLSDGDELKYLRSLFVALDSTQDGGLTTKELSNGVRILSQASLVCDTGSLSANDSLDDFMYINNQPSPSPEASEPSSPHRSVTRNIVQTDESNNNNNNTSCKYSMSNEEVNYDNNNTGDNSRNSSPCLVKENNDSASCAVFNKKLVESPTNKFENGSDGKNDPGVYLGLTQTTLDEVDIDMLSNGTATEKSSNVFGNSSGSRDIVINQYVESGDTSQPVKERKSKFLPPDFSQSAPLSNFPTTNMYRRASKAGCDAMIYNDLEFQELISRVALDGSDTVEYSDFLAASMDKRHYLNENVLRAAFRVFDRDGDGHISSRELRSALGWADPFGPVSISSPVYLSAIESADASSLSLVDQQVGQIISDVDHDGDGYIGFEDFTKLITGNDEDDDDDECSCFISDDGNEVLSMKNRAADELTGQNL